MPEALLFLGSSLNYLEALRKGVKNLNLDQESLPCKCIRRKRYIINP